MRSGALLSVAVALFLIQSARATIVANQVVSYSSNPATTPSSYWGAPYSNPAAALGLPDQRQNVPNLFDSGGNQIAFADNTVITPFNASYNPANVVAIAPMGSLTVHLSAPIEIGPGAAIGIHSAAGLRDSSFPDGQNSSPAKLYTNSRQADLQVSADGNMWTDLGDHSYDIPTLIDSDEPDPYGSTPGTVLADLSKPFFGSLSSFDGLDWNQTRALLDGSAGGTWFDLSSVPLTRVSYVRLNTGANEVMYVDAIVGDSSVPEPAMISIVSIASLLVLRKR